MALNGEIYTSPPDDGTLSSRSFVSDIPRQVGHWLFHGPIRRSLILLILIVPVAFLVVEFTHYRNLVEAERNTELQTDLRQVKDIATTFDDYLKSLSSQELAIGLDLAGPSSTEQANQHLLASAAEFSAVRQFRYLSPEGQVVAASDPTSVGDVQTDRAYFQEAIAGRSFDLTDLYLSQSSGQPTFAVSRPIHDKSGNLQGIVVATTNIDQLGKVLRLHLDPGESVAILDHQGQLVYRYPEVQVPWEERDWGKRQSILSQIQGKDFSGTFAVPGNRTTQMGALTTIHPIGWTVELFQPEAQVMAPIREELLREAGLYALIAVIGAFVALLLARRLTGPLYHLQQQAQAVGRGEFRRRIEIDGPEEVEHLARCFNQMADAVQLREEQRESARGEAEKARNQIDRILHRISDDFFALDNDWRFTYLNSGLKERLRELNIEPEKVLGQSVWELFPEAVGRPFYKGLKRAAGEQVAAHFASEWKGLNRLFEIHAYPSEDGLSVYQTDITDRVAAQHELELERARLEAVIRQMPAGVIIAEAPFGKTILVNEQLDHIWRRPVPMANFIEDYADRIGFHRDGRPYQPEDWPVPRSILRGEIVVGEEIVIKRGDGTRGVLSVSSRPVRDAEGGIVAAVGLVHDITELKEVQRLKDEFVSIASHELRTPVTSLKGYAQTLLRRRARKIANEETDLRAIKAIEKQSDRLVTLIDELLEVSRLNVGQLEIHVERLNLATLAEQTIDHLGVTTDKHHLKVEYPGPVEVEADAGRVEQVLVNLLTNAIKYSPDGGDIDLVIRPNRRRVLVSVSDQGLGIPRSKQERLFEPFYRAHRGAQQDFGGIGLGLYISRQIVERHGGKMWLESEEGTGSTFYFSLPLPSTEIPAASPTSRADPSAADSLPTTQ